MPIREHEESPKHLVTHHWCKHVIEIDPRDLQESLGHELGLVTLDLPLHIEFGLEDLLTANNLVSGWPGDQTEKPLPHKLS